MSKFTSLGTLILGIRIVISLQAALSPLCRDELPVTLQHQLWGSFGLAERTLPRADMLCSRTPRTCHNRVSVALKQSDLDFTLGALLTAMIRVWHPTISKGRRLCGALHFFCILLAA